MGYATNSIAITASITNKKGRAAVKQPALSTDTAKPTLLPQPVTVDSYIPNRPFNDPG
jgi:hypothetical protein